MTTMSHFNRSFIKLRTNCGFKTAYNFYHSNGGRRAFPFTYSHFLKIERGLRLPRAPELALMMKFLRGQIPASERGTLVLDYLRDLSGSGSVYDDLFATLIAPKASAHALNKLQRRLRINISLAQLRAIVSSVEATGCFFLFSSVPDALPVERIARMLGSSAEECAAALKLLRKHGLIRARGKGCYASPFAGRVEMLPHFQKAEILHEQLRENLGRLAGKSGDNFHRYAAMFRLNPQMLTAVIGAFGEAFDVGTGLSQSMTPLEPEEAIYKVEVSVRRLVAFSPATAPAKPAARS